MAVVPCLTPWDNGRPFHLPPMLRLTAESAHVITSLIHSMVSVLAGECTPHVNNQSIKDLPVNVYVRETISSNADDLFRLGLYACRYDHT